MKKILLGVIVAVGLTAAATYIFIPSTLTVSSTVSILAPGVRLASVTSDTKNWESWWPEKESTAAAGFHYHNHRYDVSVNSFNIIETSISWSDSSLPARMLFASVETDSTLVEWSTSIKAGANPVSRLQNYFDAQALQKDFTTLLQSLKTYAEKRENLYGMDIQRNIVTDTVLVAKKIMLNHEPTTEEIYAIVKELREYIATEKATATDQPMVNIRKDAPTEYFLMVGLPTNRVLPGKGSIELKRMPPGNIAIGEITGGPETVKRAFEQMENFRADFRLTSVAIPYAKLITDRTEIRDTTKWITRICAPIL